MAQQRLPGVYHGDVDLDLCFDCQGLWFDPQENLKLAPEAIAALFRTMHEHRDRAHQPLASRLACPTCHGALTEGFDIARTGRFITHRCPQRHGRFSSFTAFFIEKGFVRQLTRPEVQRLAAQVGSVSCSQCGAPVDLRREDACSHCRSPLSLLDPQAVEKALQHYAQAPARERWGSAEAMADALVAAAREQSRQRRERYPAAREDLSAQLLPAGVGAVLAVDLFRAGLGLVAGLLDD